MADKKQLAVHVTVGGTTYAPGDEIPDDVAEQITNPAAWVSEEDADAAEATATARRKAGTRSGDRLATVVTVGGATYGPGDAIPDDVAEQITNPAAWEGGKLPSAAKTAPAGDGDGEKADAEPKAPRKAATPAAKRA